MYERIYGSYEGAKALAYKLILSGYFWLTMKKDMEELVRNVKSARDIWMSLMNLLLSSTHWALYGPLLNKRIDILSFILLVVGQKQVLIVKVDYFIKWVKAKPLTTTTQQQAIDFLWKNILYDFGLPRGLGHQ